MASPVFGLINSLTVYTVLLGYRGCPEIPWDIPSLVSARAAHSLGNNNVSTHSYTSMEDPCAREFQLPVL